MSGNQNPTETQNPNSDGETPTEKRDIIYKVKLVHSCETMLCRSETDETFTVGDSVVVPSRYGKDLGVILGPMKDSPTNKNGKSGKGGIPNIIRRATESDLQRSVQNKEREARAIEICREKITKHGLNMKLVSAHYLVDEPKVLFFFTAESRVDFRALVKDLVSVFKMRIELRQIGVRDESRVLGGVAVCGRCYCCHAVTDRLRPVSIKMAKEQNLSLNSMKISGPCGRLLCCLSYEYDFYHDEKKKYPAEGHRLKIDGQTYKINEVNIFTKTARISGGEGGIFEVSLSKFSREGDRWILPSTAFEGE